MEYSSEVARHFAAPRHAGVLPPGPGTLVRGEGGSVEQGAWVIFQARIDAGRVAALAWQVYGCPHVIAACSLVAETLTGCPAAELGTFEPLSLRAPLEVPALKTGRLLIIQDALRKCLAAWDNGGQSVPLPRGIDGGGRTD
jgi:hypothetical protein